MPLIVTDSAILAAARNAIEVLLKFKGQSVTLARKGEPIPKPGGGHDFTNPIPIAAQTFAWSQIGDDIVEDSDSGDTPVVKRDYVLTGRWNADIRPDDTWEDAEATYRVDSVNTSNGFKVSAFVVGFVKVSEPPEVFVPEPVSHFDFHEGSGNFTASIVPGGYVLTTPTPSIAWDGQAAAARFDGVVGPAGLTEYTVAIGMNVSAHPAGIASLAHVENGNPWLNWNSLGQPGPWPPDMFGALAVPIGVLSMVVFTFSATESRVYVDGELGAILGSNNHMVDLSVPWTFLDQDTPVRTYHSIRFWNEVLTPDQIAVL